MWYKKAQNIIQDIENRWTSQGIVLMAHEDDKAVYLDSLIVPPEQRKQGLGTQIMNELTNYADSVQKRLELSPGERDPYQGTTSRGRLVNFYKRFGLKENKGRNKDYSLRHQMFRNPQ